MSPLRFVIVNAYSARNAGDAAINVATAQLLREHGHVTIASRYASEDADFYESRQISVVSPPIPFPPRGSVANGLRFLIFMMGAVGALGVAALFRLVPPAGALLARWIGLESMTSLFRADGVVMCGGGYLYSARRLVNLTMAHVALTSVVTRLAGVPLLMMPQSIGPLSRPLDRFMVRAAVAGVPTVLVRDMASFRTAHALRLGSPIQLVPDIAFWLARPKTREAGQRHGMQEVGLSRPTFCIVCMDWTWARRVGPGALDDYVERLTSVAQILVSGGGQVVLSGMSVVGSHAQDDFVIAERVRARLSELGTTVTVARAESLDDISEILGASTVVVGTRLHSCIIAMTRGVPAIALGYQPKTRGTYELLGLSDLCFDAETFQARDVAALALEIAAHLPEWVERIRARTDSAQQELEGVVSAMIKAARA